MQVCMRTHKQCFCPPDIVTQRFCSEALARVRLALPRNASTPRHGWNHALQQGVARNHGFSYRLRAPHADIVRGSVVVRCTSCTSGEVMRDDRFARHAASCPSGGIHASGTEQMALPR